MLQLRRILFPTDLSPCAEGAFTHAAFLAATFDAELHVLHVAEGPRSAPEDWAGALAITPEDVAADLGLPMPDASASDPKEPLALVEAERQAPRAAPAVLDYVREHDVDLVVMGTHGRRGFRRLLMGSTAEEVIRLSPCPVLTVGGAGEDGGCTDSEAVRYVVAPVDLSEASAEAARHAAALAETYHARLDLLFVVDTALVGSAKVPFSGVIHVAADEVRQNAEAALRQQAEALRAEFPGAGEVGVEVRMGRPATAVATFVEEGEADLLVIGTHGRSGLDRLLVGSVAQEVVRAAPCPVFTVKTHGRRILPPTARP